MSSSQQQLLRLLNIAPLQIRQQLLTANENAAVTTESIAEQNHSTDLPMQSPLALDIAMALGNLRWQLDAQLAQCELKQQTMYTPELPKLRLPELKKQLWRLLVDNGAVDEN